MRMLIVGRCAASAVVLALALTAVPWGSASATTALGWKVGECYSTADVSKDLIDLHSRISCASPHSAQILGGAALPAAFAKHSLSQLLDQKDTKLRTELRKFSDQTCSGRKIAPGIWPNQGAAIAKALTGLAATAGGGVVPALPGSINYGWVFPDAKSYAAGDRSMICVIYPVEFDGKVTPLAGDARLLGTPQALPKMRVCYTYDAASKVYAISSCAVPHKDEQLAFFAGKLPAAYADMTDAQWAQLDAQCHAIAEALVGADRKDLRAYVDVDAATAANKQVYLACYVSRITASDGTTPNLPGGTMVGFGKKPLKSV